MGDKKIMFAPEKREEKKSFEERGMKEALI